MDTVIIKNSGKSSYGSKNIRSDPNSKKTHFNFSNFLGIY